MIEFGKLMILPGFTDRNCCCCPVLTMLLFTELAGQWRHQPAASFMPANMPAHQGEIGMRGTVGWVRGRVGLESCC